MLTPFFDNSEGFYTESDHEGIELRQCLPELCRFGEKFLELFEDRTQGSELPKHLRQLLEISEKIERSLITG